MKFEAIEGSESREHSISLKDGESIVGLFQGDEFTYRRHWTSDRPVICSDPCLLCKNGDKPTFRFRMNMVVGFAEEHETMKILEGGWKLYTQLHEINKEYPLESNYIKISRKGSKKNDTTYTALPVPIKPSEEFKLKAKAIPLINLNPNIHKKMNDDFDEVPF